MLASRVCEDLGCARTRQPPPRIRRVSLGSAVIDVPRLGVDHIRLANPRAATFLFRPCGSLGQTLCVNFMFTGFIDERKIVTGQSWRRGRSASTCSTAV